MSWILDILIVVIAGLTIFFAIRNGFLKTLLSAASFAICIIVTVIFISPLSSGLAKTALADKIRTTTSTHIANYIDDDSLGGIEDLLNGESEKFNKLLKVAGTDREELKNWYESNVAKSDKGASEKIAEKICDPIISLIASVLALIILFFGTKLVLFLLMKLLEQLTKLPILHSFDKLLGVVIGVLLAFFRICLLCYAVRILTENSLFIDFDFISKLEPDKTLLFKYFYNIDLFGFLKSLL